MDPSRMSITVLSHERIFDAPSLEADHLQGFEDSVRLYGTHVRKR